MATGGDDTAIVDQDEDPPVETKQVGAAEEDESGWLDNDDKDQQGVGRPRKQSKRNAAGILRIDTTAAAAAAAGFNSRRKSSASSVGDFRSGATYLNPQVRQSKRQNLKFLFFWVKRMHGENRLIFTRRL